MSHSGKANTELGFPSLSDQFRQALSCDADNKPDFRELDLGSPVSPLRTRGLPTSSTSSSSSGGSITGCRTNVQNAQSAQNVQTALGKNHSGELSGSSESSPTAQTASTRGFKPGHVRSDSVTSPPVNVLPTGNICPSGRILKTGMQANRSSRTDVLGSGTGNYGHGSIVRGGSGGSASGSAPAGVAQLRVGGGGMDVGKRSVDAEELKRVGNEEYRRRNFSAALSLYDRAIALVPGNAAYRSNRAAALTGLGRLWEAVREFEEAVKLDPSYWRAHHRLGSLLIRLGQVECARRHLCIPGHQPDPAEMQKLQSIEKHLSKCGDARKFGDWKGALREGEAAIAAGADSCPQLFMFRTEAHLQLNQLEDAESSLLNVPKPGPRNNSSLQTKFFGMNSEAYLFFVRAHIEMALGRFDNAVRAAEKAGQLDPQNVEVAALNKNVKLVARARARGNDLFKSERFTEACAAYGEGLRLDPSNSVLYCNRAACYFKLGHWERSINDCSQALRIQPNYMKALCRRAACYSKLGMWEDAVRDYEILRRECPDDNDIAEGFFHAQVALKKFRGEEVYNMKFGGDVEEVSGLEQFRAAISLQGVSVVYFKAASDLQCKQLSPFVDDLCGRYPSINFLQVDIEGSPAVADCENVRIVPTFKVYKNGSRVKEIVCPSRDILEHSVRHYSI